jgi:hypothetical protein
LIYSLEHSSFPAAAAEQQQPLVFPLPLYSVFLLLLRSLWFSLLQQQENVKTKGCCLW